MSAIGTVFKEHVKNFYLIQRLAQFQVKIINHSNYLGVAWELINPVMQIMVYWMVFGLGIRSNAPIMVYLLFIGYWLVSVCGSSSTKVF